MKKRSIILAIVVILNIAVILLYYKYIIVEKKDYIGKYNIGISEKVNLSDIELEEQKEMKLYNIYLPNSDLSYLLLKNIEIKEEKTITEKIYEIYFFIKNNSANGISLETKLYNVYIEGETAYLNFSKELNRYIDSAESEQIIIYSIVNSVCEINEIKKVKFLIENQNVKELGGYIDISDYFRPDKLLVKGD